MSPNLEPNRHGFALGSMISSTSSALLLLPALLIPFSLFQFYNKFLLQELFVIFCLDLQQRNGTLQHISSHP